MATGDKAGALIDARIAELGGWRGETLARLRAIVTDADPGVVEEWKWNVPVWTCNGILTTGEVYKAAVKLTFAKGAALPDPSKLFNSSLEGATRRAIDFREGDKIDAKALKAAVSISTSNGSATAAEWRPTLRSPSTGTRSRRRAASQPPARMGKG